MDGKASGEAFVVFNSFEGVKKALQLDKEKMRDRCGGGRGLVWVALAPGGASGACSWTRKDIDQVPLLA
jgi:hypothetical protein